MKLLTNIFRHICFASTLLAITSLANATQTHKTEMSLHDELAQQDALFFQRGFNECDMAYLDASISPELKFYHDKSGFQDKALFMQNTQKYICGDMAHKPIRKLINGSLRTFELRHEGILYGAVQHGEHEFYIREAGKPDQLTGTARFTSVWLKKGEDWQLSDVLSYDHQPPKAVIDNN